MRGTLAILGLCLVSACGTEQRFVGDVITLAMTERSNSVIPEEHGSLFAVERTTRIPVVEPGEALLRELRQDAEGLDLPFGRLPFINLGDLAVRLDWSAKNLAPEPVEATLTITAGNEFHRYVPTYRFLDGQVVPDLALIEVPLLIEPHGSVHGTIDEFRFDEAATDLATLANGVTDPDQILLTSSGDPAVAPLVPETVPGLLAVTLGLRASQARPVVVEATLRVRDRADRLAPEGSDDDFRPSMRPILPAELRGE